MNLLTWNFVHSFVYISTTSPTLWSLLPPLWGARFCCRPTLWRSLPCTCGKRPSVQWFSPLRFLGVVRVSVDHFLTSLSHGELTNIAVGWAKGPEVLRPKLHQVLLWPHLRRIGILGRGTIPPKHVVPVFSNALHPWLLHSVHHMDVSNTIHPQALSKEEWWHDVALIWDNTNNRHSGWSFVEMTASTSRTSEHI